MTAVIDRVKGKITGYDERRGVVTIEAPYADFAAMCSARSSSLDLVIATLVMA